MSTTPPTSTPARPPTDVAALLTALHAAALETRVFPVGGLRTRAARRDHYIIADGHPDNAFIHVQIRIGHGRTPEVRQKAAEHIFAALKSDHRRQFWLNIRSASRLEIVEIDPIGALKHNNLHDYVETRQTRSAHHECTP